MSARFVTLTWRGISRKESGPEIELRALGLLFVALSRERKFL